MIDFFTRLLVFPPLELGATSRTTHFEIEYHNLDTSVDFALAFSQLHRLRVSALSYPSLYSSRLLERRLAQGRLSKEPASAMGKNRCGKHGASKRGTNARKNKEHVNVMKLNALKPFMSSNKHQKEPVVLHNPSSSPKPVSRRELPPCQVQKSTPSALCALETTRRSRARVKATRPPNLTSPATHGKSCYRTHAPTSHTRSQYESCIFNRTFI